MRVLTLSYLLGFGGIAVADCLPVTADRIFARDLAVVAPEFGRLPASLFIGFAPVPGAPRVFASSELIRIAHANGLAVSTLPEACFEIPMQVIGGEQIAEAMRKSLPPLTEVKVIEMPTAKVPAGQIEFSGGGLEPPSAATGIQLWRGFIRYAGTHTAPIWARVSLLQRMESVVTVKDLLPNEPVGAQSVRVQAWEGQPVRERVALRLEDVLRKVPKHSLKAGSLIPMALLDEAPSVRRGETVRVEVHSGPARLVFSAVAEKAGRDGEMLQMRNPSTGKTFLGRIEGAKVVMNLNTEAAF